MTGRLEERVVLVTGAASGIGRATALEVATRGGGVVAVDRSADGLAETVALVTQAGGRVLAAPTDVSDEPAVANAVALAVETFGRLDGVVTSAGIFDGPDLQPVADVSLETFVHTLSVNLVGTFLAIKHALPHLTRDDTAAAGDTAARTAIVTIASTAAIRGHGYGAGYTASKGGVHALTRLVAVQYGPRGVRANCICPGGVDTPMTAGAWNSDEARARTKRTVPLGSVASAEDIASVAGFLLSDDARHVTGQTLTVDGGATIA